MDEEHKAKIALAHARNALKKAQERLAAVEARLDAARQEKSA